LHSSVGQAAARDNLARNRAKMLKYCASHVFQTYCSPVALAMPGYGVSSDISAHKD
jgi:hypothetical protein